MAAVKRPGTPEAHLEAAGAPTRITPPQSVVTITTPGVATMAKKAPKTGTYKIGDDYFFYAEGAEFPNFPDGVAPQFQEGPTADTDEERTDGPAPENRARKAAPENR